MRFLGAAAKFILRTLALAAGLVILVGALGLLARRSGQRYITSEDFAD